MTRSGTFQDCRLNPGIPCETPSASMRADRRAPPRACQKRARPRSGCVVEAVAQLETPDLCTLHVGAAPLVTQRELDPKRPQPVDRLMRVGQVEHLFPAKGGEAI